jgi:hypothetical protein
MLDRAADDLRRMRRASEDSARRAVELLWTGKSLLAPSDSRSSAYDELLLRTFPAEVLPEIRGRNAVEYVPRPFHEAFEHQRSRPDVDTGSFVFDVLGRAGMIVGAAVVFLALVAIALATGWYAPGGQKTSNTPPPQQQTQPQPQPQQTQSQPQPQPQQTQPQPQPQQTQPQPQPQPQQIQPQPQPQPPRRPSRDPKSQQR